MPYGSSRPSRSIDFSQVVGVSTKFNSFLHPQAVLKPKILVEAGSKRLPADVVYASAPSHTQMQALVCFHVALGQALKGEKGR